MSQIPEFLNQLRPTLNQLLHEPAEASAVGPSYRVPLNEPTFDADEILEALDSMLKRRVTMGEKVATFERRFAEYIGVKHAVLCNSGSSANLLIMAAASNPLRSKAERLMPGDEVIVPALTWSTTLWPVIQGGLVPVLADSNEKTLNIDVEASRQACGPKTRAIFLAHILGNAADMDGFRALAREKSLQIFEDSCEALGTRYKGSPTGRFSVAASFSFYFSHHITTIEGGMVVTDDDEFADLCRCIRAHGWSRNMQGRARFEAMHPDIDPRYLFINSGYNLRPTEIQGAFGLHQLRKLDGFNQDRVRAAERMRAGFASLGDRLQLIEPETGVDHTWFGFPVVLRGKFSGRRDELAQHLEQNGIETRPIIAGNLARQPALQLFSHRIGGDLPNADRIMRDGIYWGIHPRMDNRDIDYLISIVRGFMTT